MTIYEDLQWRGLIADCTHADLVAQRLASPGMTVYCGFDPTADSLQIGNLVPLLALRRFQLAGHRPIALAGGATGGIGDPSGKASERQLLTQEQINANLAKVRGQLERLLDFAADGNSAQLVNNADWIAPLTFIDFLRETGKHFTVNQMVAKESVRARMEGDSGISFTEFSYMLIQAQDFYHLYHTEGCELQIGGSDQWGNITAGTDLIRKKLGKTAYGLTLPLITKADGTKFGKSAGESVWLDAGKTSVYRFYQYWLNTDDRDAGPFLRYFTLLHQEEILALEARHAQAPEKREAQRALAVEVTTLVHGPEALRDAIRASEILFGGSIEGITEAAFAEIAGEVPRWEVERAGLSGKSLVDLLAESGLSPSKSQARKDIQSGGIYVNNQRVSEIEHRLSEAALLFDRQLLLRKGKKNYVMVTVK